VIHFDLRIIGQNAVENKLRTAAATGSKRVNNAAYRWAENNVMSQLRTKAYPPERLGQKYKRTGKLGRGWRLRQDPASIVIRNAMNYSGYVVGDGKGERQAWMHVSRWWKVRDLIDEQRPKLKEMVVDELNFMLQMGMGPR
jgi:hypothetical protein